jgi:large subunit ribosomal protein L30
VASKLLIRQRRSSAGANRPQRETLRTLGLHGIGTSTERPDGPALRGLLRRVGHLVEVQESKESKAKAENKAEAANA